MLPLSSVISSPVISTNTVSDTSNLQADEIKDEIKKVLDQRTQNKYVMVFSGFSGLGYSDQQKLESSLDAALSQAISEHSAEKLCVVAGATPEGIGIIYQIAKNKGIATLGIVSVQAQGSTSEYCDHTVYVDDPDSSWKVLDAAGNSYMVYVATENEEISRTGEFLAFGGGEVTLSELREAEAVGLKTVVYPDFDPSPEKAVLKQKNAPGVELTPVKREYHQLSRWHQ